MQDDKQDELMSKTEAPEVIEPMEQPSYPAPSVNEVPAEVEQSVVTPPIVSDMPLESNVKQLRNKMPLIVGLVLLAVVLVGVGAFFLGRQTKSNAPVAAVAPNVVTKTVTKQVAATPPAPTFTDTYFQTAAPLATTPKMFKTAAEGGPSCYQDNGKDGDCSYVYKKIGTTKDGKAIIAVDNSGAGISGAEYIALQTGTNTYSILSSYGALYFGNNQDSQTNFQNQLDPSTTLDTVTKLPDLAFDQDITYKGMALSTQESGNYAILGHILFNGLTGSATSNIAKSDSQLTKLGNYGAYTLYQVTAQEGASYAVKNMHMVVNQVYDQPYVYDSPLNSSSKPANITWADSSGNTDEFSYRNPGCGNAYGYLVAKNISADDVTKAGTGPDNQAIYSLSTSSALFQEIYNNDYGSGANVNDASLKNLSADQFQAKHGFFLAKDGLGEYVVYLNSKLIIGGGCGKPVVYLYPTQTQTVNVAVDATVQKSVPAYPVGGWQGVTAQSNGQLTYQGQSYPNLYWEGIGRGEYPVVDSGVVVASNQAVTTIRRQLVEQGLNTNEIKDFLDYWQPKLPHTKYVRLTWFNTAQMNELAPLSIAPKPMTTLRVFLDFQGLDRKIPLAEQHLSGTPRLGFTAVEWGGLDRSDGISH